MNTSNPFNKTGPLSDEEADFIRHYIQQATADHVPADKLRPLVAISPQLVAVATSMGSGDDIANNRKKVEGLLYGNRSAILTATADLFINSKRFTFVMVSLAAFGGAAALFLELFPAYLK